MPHIAGDPENVVDAVKLAEALDINYEIIDITPYVDQYFWDNEPNASKMRRGNFMARIRMTILFDLSVEYDALVLGTSNRSELLTGYSTQFGDNACAFEPIGHLYKTEVYELSKQMNISKEIIEKIPTADFWQGQTDEEEMKIGYKPLDEILYLLYEKKIPLQEVLEKGYKQEEVERVVQLYNGSAFKRKLPPTIEEI
jgi:NAD+ synthase